MSRERVFDVFLILSLGLEYRSRETNVSITVMGSRRGCDLDVAVAMVGTVAKLSRRGRWVTCRMDRNLQRVFRKDQLELVLVLLQGDQLGEVVDSLVVEQEFPIVHRSKRNIDNLVLFLL